MINKLMLFTIISLHGIHAPGFAILYVKIKTFARYNKITKRVTSVYVKLKKTTCW